jgi:translocation and assembly module TamA
MKWLPTALLLWLATGAVAQVVPPPDQASAPQNAAGQPASETGPAAFTLDIEAPDEIRQLLERHLELQRYRALTDLSDDELNRLLDMAQVDTQKLVATLGYFSPLIEIARPPPGDQPRHVSIRVTVGEPVQVSQVLLHFAGSMATDPAAAAQRQLIQESWSLPVGNRFTQTRWDSAKKQALRQLSTQRYALGRISQTQADIDPLTHQARLDVTLDSGPAYQIGELVISGLQRFDAALVRRLARLPVGADYDQRQLVAAQQRLTDSGFFGTAFLAIDTGSDLQAASVLVTLREARLQKIIFGVGASTDSGARLSLEHLHNQLPGLGWRALSKVSLDRENQSIGVGLISPPNDSNWRWNTALVLQHEISGSFALDSQSWRAGASQQGERIDRSYYLQYDRADSAATDPTAPAQTQSISANYAFTLRNFDAMPHPSGGWAFGAELGGGTTLGNSAVPFGRVLTRWQYFLPLAGQHAKVPDLRAGRLALRALAGAVLAQQGAALPATQLFLTGGDNSVRGYGLNDIGTELAGGLVSAGRYLAAGSLEWQRPITRNGLLTEWETALFIDAGAVADHPVDLQAQVGVGAGLRWKTPVGPLQIDLAYGVAVQQWRLHLNVGFSF